MAKTPITPKRIQKNKKIEGTPGSNRKTTWALNNGNKRVAKDKAGATIAALTQSLLDESGDDGQGETDGDFFGSGSEISGSSAFVSRLTASRAEAEMAKKNNGDAKNEDADEGDVDMGNVRYEDEDRFAEFFGGGSV